MKFLLLLDRNYDIIALQEIHWKDKFIEGYKHVWKGQIYYNNVDTSSKGNMYGKDKFTTIMWTHPLKEWHF